MTTPNLDRLIGLVRAASEGSRMDLALHLEVSRQQLNDWLSGRRQPGGEVTLQMLQWVTAREAQQKSPGSAQTPPERMAPTKDKQDESPKSGPRKRSHKRK